MNLGSESEQVEFKRLASEMREGMESIAFILNKHTKIVSYRNDAFFNGHATVHVGEFVGENAVNVGKDVGVSVGENASRVGDSVGEDAFDSAL